jgi:hypothetical protein
MVLDRAEPSRCLRFISSTCFVGCFIDLLRGEFASTALVLSEVSSPMI